MGCPFYWSSWRFHLGEGWVPAFCRAGGRAGGESQGVGLQANYFSANFINQHQYTRRRRRPRRPEAAARRPEPRGIRPPSRCWQKGWPGSAARGRRGRGGEGGADRRPRAPASIPKERACRIGAASQAVWISITPMRSPESKCIHNSVPRISFLFWALDSSDIRNFTHSSVYT